MYQMLKKIFPAFLSKRGNFVLSPPSSHDKNSAPKLLAEYSVFRYGVNKLEGALQPLVAKGLRAVLIFGVPSNFNKVMSYS